MNNQQTVQQVTEATRELSNLLIEENEALRSKQVKQIEPLLKRKKRAAFQLEKTLQTLKQTQGLQNDQSIKTEFASLQRAMQDYHALARKNLLLLKAEHEATADFLDMIRVAAEKKKSTANVYGQDGAMESRKGNQTSLLNKNI